jgi:ATP-dependent protease Clp ATPase subunit
MSEADYSTTPTCTACLKSQSEVSYLIIMERMRICNECVGMCVKLIIEREEKYRRTEVVN